MTAHLEAAIEAAWEDRANVTPASDSVREAVEAVFELLESGKARVAQKVDGAWQVNQWLKKAVLLSFRLNDNVVIDAGSGGAPAFDKVPSKFEGWDDARFREAGFRVVPGAIARKGAHQGRRADAKLRQHRRICR
jgi:2,3,4,5-tetrahydropyridine-2-carboxylate N-succinyltransferase